MKATLEREVKLAPGPEFRELELAGRELPARVLVSTYHDTDDLRLAKAQITLRRREQEGSAVWQLKLPADGDRTELEWPAESPAVPDRIANLLLAHSRGRSLSPIATLRTTRAGVVVQDGGVDVAEVTEDHVEVIGDSGVVQSFDEIEIELLDGDAGALRDLVRTVRRSGAVEADARPKLFRSIGFRPDSRAEPDPADSRASLRAAMLEQFQTIVANDPRTRLGDPDALHDQRVAVRRLRAQLRVARPLLDRQWADNLRADLRPVGGSLSAVRDLDVLHERLAAEVERLPEQHRRGGELLLADIDARRRTAQLRMIDQLSSPWYLALLNRLEQALAEPRFSGKGSLERGARHAHRRVARMIGMLGNEPSDAELHEVRKAAKRARYAAELADATSGRRSHDTYIKRAKQFQDVLGGHQDASVAIAVLAGLAREETAAAAVHLAAGEERRRLACRAAFARAWRRLDRAA